MESFDRAFDERRYTSNPLFGDNGLKLGLFAYNGNGPQMTAAEERFVVTWPRSLALARLGDAMGLEVQVSHSLYRNSINGDGRHTANLELEPLTWSAGIGASIEQSAVIATLHPALLPPALVAKGLTTVDNITGGRAGMNIVAGFSQYTYDQFGASIEPPDVRYDRAQEFVDVLKQFWREEDEFTFEGRFYTVRRGVSRPKPVQPFPAIMNAGQSGRGRDWAARNADLAFTLLGDEQGWAAQIAAYRDLAFQSYGRSLQVWTHSFLVIADSEKDAADYLRSYAVDRVDQPWLDGWISNIGEGLSTLRPEQLSAMQRNWTAGGGLPIVGTAEMVADQLVRVHRAGLDGVLLSALEPEVMIQRFRDQVLPALEAAGLRKRYTPREGLIAARKADQGSSETVPSVGTEPQALRRTG